MKIYMIMRKPLRKGKEPEQWDIEAVDNPNWPYLKTFLAFRSRRTAMRWVHYWNDGEKYFQVFEVNINI